MKLKILFDIQNQREQRDNQEREEKKRLMREQKQRDKEEEKRRQEAAELKLRNLILSSTKTNIIFFQKLYISYAIG